MLSSIFAIAAATALLSSLASATVSSQSISGIVLGAERPQALPVSDARLILNGGELTTVSRGDGSFVFHNVSSGVHLLEIQPTIRYVYSTFKIQIDDAASSEGGEAERIKVVEYRHPGAAKIAAQHPIIASPVAPAIYFDERPKSSPFAFLLNPQILIMLVMGGMAYCLPKMQAQMNPEEMREMQRTMGTMNPNDPAAMLSSLFSGATAAGGGADGDRDGEGRDQSRQQRRVAGGGGSERRGGAERQEEEAGSAGGNGTGARRRIQHTR